MTLNQKVAALISGAALVGTLGLGKVVKAEEYNANGWPIPNISTAKQGSKTFQEDIIRNIPGDETIQRVYRTPEGTFFNTLSIADSSGNEKLYGFYVDTDGKPPMEYTLIDLEGDGKFRSKYQGNETWPTPQYLLDKISKK